jgi:retron-type reverse transcriptase
LEVITLPKHDKDPKFSKIYIRFSLLSTTGKIFQKVILNIVQKHIEERGLLNAIQFGFRARHSTTLQCMRLTDHVTHNFNNKMSTAAVFTDIEKAFDTTWHSGLLYKLSKLEFSTSLIKLISSFLSQRKFSVSVEDEMSTPREMQTGVPQGSVLSPTLYNMYINDAPKTSGVYLAPFADDTSLHATDRKRVLLSENSSVVSAQWRPGVSTGILKLMKIRLRGFTFLAVVDGLSPILH